MKKIALIIGAILVAGLIGAGGFWGGMKYQENKTSQAQQNFLAARGQPGSEVFTPGGQRFENGQAPGNGQRGVFMGPGTTGQIKSIDGNTLTLSTAEDVKTVTLSDQTRVERTDTVGTDALESGMQVMISGQTGSDGILTATSIVIVTEAMLDRFSPSATRTAP